VGRGVVVFVVVVGGGVVVGVVESLDMFVWQGVAIDSLKYHSGLPCPTLYALRSNHT
jgi:hypothetical protein